jgi:hypothetical protein
MSDVVKRWWLRGGFVLLGLVTLALPLRLPLFRLNQTVYDGMSAVALGDRRIRQTFFSYYPGLSEVRVRPAAQLPPEDQSITLRLRAVPDDGSGGLSLTRAVRELRDGDELRFAFNPLDDSAGKKYLIEIETAGPAPLTLMGNHRDIYPRGELAGGGDLSFEVRYNGFLWPTLGVFLSRLTYNRSGLLAQPWFYVGLVALHTLVLVGVLMRLSRYVWLTSFVEPQAPNSRPEK